MHQDNTARSPRAQGPTPSNSTPVAAADYNIDPRPLLVCVVREEFVALTGDAESALVLNQLLYWQGRNRDIDRYIAEEKRRLNESADAASPGIPPTGGWFYVSADDLIKQTMQKCSASTMRRWVKRLIGRGWVLERENPHRKWDRTKQYRVDVPRLKHDLAAINYPLNEWWVHPKAADAEARRPASSKMKNAFSTIENASSKTEARPSKMIDRALSGEGSTTTEIAPEIPETSQIPAAAAAAGVEPETAKLSETEQAAFEFLTRTVGMGESKAMKAVRQPLGNGAEIRIGDVPADRWPRLWQEVGARKGIGSRGNFLLKLAGDGDDPPPRRASIAQPGLFGNLGSGAAANEADRKAKADSEAEDMAATKAVAECSDEELESHRTAIANEHPLYAKTTLGDVRNPLKCYVIRKLILARIRAANRSC